MTHISFSAPRAKAQAVATSYVLDYWKQETLVTVSIFSYRSWQTVKGTYK